MIAPRPARPEEVSAAFALLFRHLTESEREYRVRQAAEMVARGDLDPAGLLVLAVGSFLRGVFLCQPTPGAGGIAWPPVVVQTPAAPAEDALVQAGCAWLHQRGAKLAQCLLTDAEFHLAAPLLRNGFRHVTGLSYLRHDLKRGAGETSPPSRLTYTSYDAADPKRFHEAIVRTYEQSQDCPEVNGLRTIEEVIAGHQAQGRYDPQRWWLATYQGQTAGVLITIESVPGEWEVAYMGVVPEARRQRFGREMLQHALEEARRAEMDHVHLCVDDRNRPARRLYDGLGFLEYDHREVLLCLQLRGCEDGRAEAAVRG